MKNTNNIAIIKHSKELGPHIDEKFGCLYKYDDEILKTKNYVEAIISNEELDTIKNGNLNEVEEKLKNLYYKNQIKSIYENIIEKINTIIPKDHFSFKKNGQLAK